MARTSSKSSSESETPAEVGEATGTQGESISGYFRRLFEAKPRLLKLSNNDKIFKIWLQDHPDQTEVPLKVKQGLANIKSLMRKKTGKRGRRPAAAEARPKREAAPAAPRVRESRSGLEQLEEQIDECLTAAKGIDRAGLEKVIQHLVLARREVVWRIGQ